MKQFRRGDTGVTAERRETITGSRPRWRLPGRVVTALAAVSLGTGLVTAFATAASAAPAPSPAAGVAPGAVTTTGTSRYVFYTAADGSVWQKGVGDTTAATAVGGVLISAPSPIFDGTHILVFGEGTDNALWYTSCMPGGNCSPWASLGGVLSSKPGAVQVDTTHAYDQSVYVRGSDGTMWARDNTATGWAPWHSVGGRLLSGTGPSAAVRGGSQYVLVAGTNRELFLLLVGGPGFTPEGGITGDSPALTNTSGSLVGYARGTNGAGYYSTMNGAWHSLGGYLTSGLGATTTTVDNTPYAYALGGDGQVYQNMGNTAGSWSEVTP